MNYKSNTNIQIRIFVENLYFVAITENSRLRLYNYFPIIKQKFLKNKSRLPPMAGDGSQKEDKNYQGEEATEDLKILNVLNACA